MQFCFQQTPAKAHVGQEATGPSLPGPTKAHEKRSCQDDTPKFLYLWVSLEKRQNTNPPCAVRARLTGEINEIAVCQYRYYDKHRVAFYLWYVGRERKRKTPFLTLGT